MSFRDSSCMLALTEYPQLKPTENDINTSHLIALQNQLFNEKSRFAIDKSTIRAVWIAQTEREIKGKMEFIGMLPVICEMTDDELLALLA